MEWIEQIFTRLLNVTGMMGTVQAYYKSSQSLQIRKKPSSESE